MEPKQKCTVCSRRILEGDDVLFEHGEVIHQGCVLRLSSQKAIAESWKLIRRSRNLIDRPAAEWKPKNDHDSNGWPICPACKQSLAPGASALRSGDYMLHPDCPDEF
jgi:hypothetical protein